MDLRSRYSVGNITITVCVGTLIRVINSYFVEMFSCFQPLESSKNHAWVEAIRHNFTGSFLTAHECLDITGIRGLTGVLDKLPDLSRDRVQRVQRPRLIAQQRLGSRALEAGQDGDFYLRLFYKLT